MDNIIIWLTQYFVDNIIFRLLDDVVDNKIFKLTDDVVDNIIFRLTDDVVDNNVIEKFTLTESFNNTDQVLQGISYWPKEKYIFSNKFQS